MAKARPKAAAPKAIKNKSTGARKTPTEVKAQVKSIMANLKRLATPKIRDEMGTRYGIHTDKAFGIAVGTLQTVAKEIGKSHDIAMALWKEEWYEARMLASFIDVPELVTPKQMDEWCEDFDNWGICDTVCFKLFDQTPHAFSKIAKWTKRKEEFVRRGGFALLACVALHNKDASEEDFAKCLPMIEAAAEDDRNFVKKSVNWALRALGYVQSPSIRQGALELARQLAISENATARWIGKDALKTLEKAVQKTSGGK
jgi:3-methyladenine DNA glycosylase AlkD